MDQNSGCCQADSVPEMTREEVERKCSREKAAAIGNMIINEFKNKGLTIREARDACYFAADKLQRIGDDTKL